MERLFFASPAGNDQVVQVGGTDCRLGTDNKLHPISTMEMLYRRVWKEEDPVVVQGEKKPVEPLSQVHPVQVPQVPAVNSDTDKTTAALRWLVRHSCKAVNWTTEKTKRGLSVGATFAYEQVAWTPAYLERNLPKAQHSFEAVSIPGGYASTGELYYATRDLMDIYRRAKSLQGGAQKIGWERAIEARKFAEQMQGQFEAMRERYEEAWARDQEEFEDQFNELSDAPNLRECEELEHRILRANYDLASIELRSDVGEANLQRAWQLFEDVYALKCDFRDGKIPAEVVDPAMCNEVQAYLEPYKGKVDAVSAVHIDTFNGRVVGLEKQLEAIRISDEATGFKQDQLEDLQQHITQLNMDFARFKFGDQDLAVERFKTALVMLQNEHDAVSSSLMDDEEVVE